MFNVCQKTFSGVYEECITCIKKINMYFKKEKEKEENQKTKKNSKKIHKTIHRNKEEKTA